MSDCMPLLGGCSRRDSPRHHQDSSLEGWTQTARIGLGRFKEVRSVKFDQSDATTLRSRASNVAGPATLTFRYPWV